MPSKRAIPAFDLKPGIEGRCDAVVGPGDTCVGSGTGDLEVLSTPRLLALFECAALAALEGTLPPALTTVGVRVELEHLLPTPVGGAVCATASLVSVRGRRLLFAVKLHDEQERALGVGRLTRAVVDRATFGTADA